MTTKKEASAPPIYSDDAPKTNPWTEDRLGFEKFASRLSKVILGLQVPRGYVIGLHGVWGSGKSTALRFVEAYLDKHNQEHPDEPIQVINFLPWLVSGHHDLVSAFFKVLNETLEPGKTKRKYFWQLWGQRVQRASDPLLKAVATVGAVVEPTGLAAAATAKFASASFDKLLDSWLAEPSLQKAYDDLKNNLAKQQRKILVIVDDIDRLQREEIRTTMQLVKSVGQLPNVVYLLAYDRQVVWAALDDFPGLKGPRANFAEKIVQQEVDLPVPSNGALLQMFDGEIRFLLNAMSENGMRWHQLVQHGVRRWLRHPRDVVRLSNAVKFCGPALMDEVDPQDLLAMEGLRLFDRPAFDWIRASRDFLFSQGVFHMANDQQRADYGTQFRESWPAEARDDVIEIISDLFPGRAQQIRGAQRHFREAHHRTVARRGVGTALGYDAYFSLYPSPDGIPKPVVDEFVRRMRDEEWLTSTLTEYVKTEDSRGSPMIGELLREISMRLYGRDGEMPTLELLKALLRVGDAVLPIEAPASFLDFPPRASWSNLITEMIGRWGGRLGGEMLLDALSATGSPAVWAEVYVALGRDAGVFPGTDVNRGWAIDEEAITQFGARLLRLIQSSAADGSLEGPKYYFDIIIAWKHLDGAEAVRAWINRGVEGSPAFLAKLAHGLVGYTVGMSKPRHYTMNQQPDADLFDAALLRDTARRYLATNAFADADDANRVSAVLDGLERATE